MRALFPGAPGLLRGVTSLPESSARGSSVLRPQGITEPAGSGITGLEDGEASPALPPGGVTPETLQQDGYRVGADGEMSAPVAVSPALLP